MRLGIWLKLAEGASPGTKLGACILSAMGAAARINCSLLGLAHRSPI